MDMKALGRKHLERRLAPLRELNFTRPQRGWLRAMREALGMTTRQLAQRMGKVQSAVVDMEKSEARESISLNSLRQAAEAMDCFLVYAIIPKEPIDDILRARAMKAKRHGDPATEMVDACPPDRVGNPAHRRLTRASAMP